MCVYDLLCEFKALNVVHHEWHPLLKKSLNSMDASYILQLSKSIDYLPDLQKIFAAFSQPLSNLKYILLGESPYPRENSANGYAFWDADVNDIWSLQGLSKKVNKATSLRNFIKMLLHAKGDLLHDFSQLAISKCNKSNYIQTATELFTALLNHGFLLLNISLIYEKGRIPYHARHWRPFMSNLLTELAQYNHNIQCVTFGKLAQNIPETLLYKRIIAEHPYNLSFIKNIDVISFFKPFNLLEYRE